MNRYFKILATAVAAAGLLASCNRESITPEQPDQPVTPEVPSGPYRLTFEGGAGIETATRASWADPNGSGNLIFQWDYTPTGEDGNEMVMAFYKEKFIASTTGNYHTYASIHRHSDPEKQQDNHYASFTSVEKYDIPLSSGYYEDCRVVALTPLRADNDTYIYSLESRVIANLPMPGTFEQNDDQEPDFLSNYMYMYADASITDGTAFLLFEHIPATFRFKITNKRPEPARINSVKVTVVDTEGVEQPVASQYVDVLAASDEDIELSYSTISYTEVTTNINTDLATDEKYTAYALVLPLFGNAPLEGKKIRFTIDASDPDNEYLSFELDAETLANANHGEYNWVGGKSYTINMRLSDVLYFESITVEDWKDGGTIDAGEAEDMTWKNGINKLTGEYEAAQLNADDYYEINNAGNLFWFAQQVNEGGEAGRYLNAILKQDIDLEGRPWTPIGTTGGTTSQSFRGIFDGNGKTIRGLYVNAQRSAQGFFGEVRKGVVKDFTIYGDVFLNGKYNYIGGVIGSACGIQGENGSTISGITSYVNVTLGEGTHGSNHVAGLIGYVNHNTTVERCMWLGKLDLDIYRAQDGVGGLIGKANAQYVGTIRDCAAYGTIRTAYQSGSYVNPSDNQPFTNIFIGGIVSNSLAGATTNIENCIWAGNIVDETDLVENAHISAIGTLNGVGSVSNCYYYLGTVPYVTTHNAYDTTDKVFGADLNQLMNGEIAAKLGDAWEQGEKYPILKK